ncbi:hypothetical protein TNCV_2227341 [Trichonephila clavipes]|uniref:Uncharacterized protein n=1 Tax=Trichonephila clavipes TaxID=2585209 RepID=A0A8X7BJF3_TRICX|nr:hypothetical protein TNCV_2227341 [Trichonephila clavipes]
MSDLVRILTLHYSTTRGLLVTDFVILNQGQTTRTTPAPAPPIPPSSPAGGLLSLDKFNMHCLPYMAGLHWYQVRTHNTLATNPLP